MKSTYKILIGFLGLAFILFGFWFFVSYFNEANISNDSNQGNDVETDVSYDILQSIIAKSDFIVVDSPSPMMEISSPLTFSGQARGTWYFEASFPIVLTDWDGKIIASSYASAVLDPSDPESTWMTEDFVPFTGTIEFDNPSWDDDFSKRGTLIFQKDNPSGLPEYDDALEIPVLFN